MLCERRNCEVLAPLTSAGLESIKVPASTEEELPPAGASDETEIAANVDRPIGRWVARKKTKSVSGPAFPEMAQTDGKTARR